MQKVLKKIGSIRKDKGYSHEYVALMLDISQAAYTKIERNQTKLTVQRLYKIAEILEVDVSELLDIQATNQSNEHNKDASTGYLQQIENFFHENKEQYDAIISHYEKNLKHKNDIILELKAQLALLRR